MRTARERPVNDTPSVLRWLLSPLWGRASSTLAGEAGPWTGFLPLRGHWAESPERNVCASVNVNCVFIPGLNIGIVVLTEWKVVM